MPPTPFRVVAQHLSRNRFVRCNSSFPRGQERALAETDALGIPTTPTWSVNNLLSSYPTPSINPTTLRHLHRLSALIPPEEGSLQHAELTAEMENLVKLVEAVKQADVNDNHETESSVVPVGRIWAENTGIPLADVRPREEGEEEAHGPALLRHASRTSGGLYVVESNRTRR